MSHRDRIYRTSGIILRRTDFGEADRLLTVLTPDRGKLRLVAKGARKPSSRKSGHVELFCHTHFLVAVGRDLDIITQAETVEPFLALRDDLLTTTYAYYVAELADAFIGEEDVSQPMFDLVEDAMGWINQAAMTTEFEKVLPLMARYYEIHVLGLAGYQPQLYVCGLCKKSLEPTVNYMSAAEGGVLCAACGYRHVGTAELSVNAQKVLRFLQTHEWESVRLLRLTEATQRELERTLGDYITYYLERKLKSVDFMNRLRRQIKPRREP
ncbi:MAG: DNA repair protein RecO [Anaerolineae bacterium]|nr:DNA repair protein RecO [Anaerolineae bacterium]